MPTLCRKRERERASRSAPHNLEIFETRRNQAVRCRVGVCITCSNVRQASKRLTNTRPFSPHANPPKSILILRRGKHGGSASAITSTASNASAAEGDDKKRSAATAGSGWGTNLVKDLISDTTAYLSTYPLGHSQQNQLNQHRWKSRTTPRLPWTATTTTIITAGLIDCR